MRAMTITLAAFAVLFIGMFTHKLPLSNAGAQYHIGAPIEPMALYDSLNTARLPETTAAEPF